MIRMAALVFFLVAGAAHAGCADDPEPCRLDDGEYHLRLPDNGGKGAPVVVFLHGAGGSGANTIGNDAVLSPLLARGYAAIAPTGSRQFGNRPGYIWAFRGDFEGRDETDFLTRVVADASARFGTDPDRVLLAGFSAGAFMVSYLACAAPDTFAAYAPVSGGFWEPIPEACAGPVKLFQTHGWSDTTVPLEGRPLRNGAFVQGDIFEGLKIWRAANGCIGQNPSSYSETGPFQRRKWDCALGSALEFALFPGGHMVPKEWGSMVLDWFEAVTAK